jgi:uncharacterized OB-fold protein
VLNISKVGYKLWKKTFPYMCNSCGAFLHTRAKMCERCGKEDSLKPITKLDYKTKYKRMREL